MIINTGSRTDIPAYYSRWFYNRIREGYVLVRNPYNPQMVTRYNLDPAVVDVLSFCSKNPEPMLDRLSELDKFRQFWHVTITPYGKDIEPGVPDKERVCRTFRKLSGKVGPERMSWRYDPVFIDEKYDMEFHKQAFARMAQTLAGSTFQCVVSFIDLYEKTKRNFPQVRPVTTAEQIELINAFSETAGHYGIQIHLCCEQQSLVRENVDADGCFSKAVLEDAIGTRLSVPSLARARKECSCLLGADIGVYNSCGHACKYCYANYDMDSVRRNMRQHDPDSPLLIGHLNPEDIVKDAVQKTWIDPQLDFFDFLG